MNHASLPHDVVATELPLVPNIRARHAELETARRVPPDVVQAIAEAGLFQLHLARSMSMRSALPGKASVLMCRIPAAPSLGRDWS